MKTSIKIMAMGALMACVACGAKKSVQSNMEENQEEMSARATDEGQNETSMNDATDQMDSMDEGGSTSDTSEAMNDGAMDGGTMNKGDMGEGSMDGDSETEGDGMEMANVPSSAGMDYLEMYSKLEMTDDQIREFEGGLRDFHSQQKTMSNGDMMGSLSDERDRQLEKILSEEQFSDYQSWKSNN